MFTTTQGVASSIALIATELATIVPLIGAEANLKPELVAQIATGIDDLKLGAQALATAESGVGVQDVLQRIMTDTNAVLAALAQIQLPPQAAMIMRIAQISLPMLESIAGMILAARGTAATG